MTAPDSYSPDDVLRVETPESVAFKLELAGLGSRGLALLVDMIIIVGFVAAELLAVLAVTWAVANLAGAYSLTWSLSVVGVLAFLTYWGYFVWGEMRGNGRTWGKKWVGLRVVRDDGSRVAFLDSAIRNIIRVVDMMPGMYGVGMVSAMISRSGKRLGDIAAGTVVVRESSDMTLYFDGGQGPPLAALAKEFLDRRAGLAPEARYQVAVEVLAAYGEDPGAWDEPTIAGRLAELAEWTPSPEREKASSQA